MSDVDLDAEQYEKHREAGEILAQVRDEAADRLEVGTSYLEISEWTEDRIRELGGTPAFPVNVSVDEEAAHGAAGPDDDRVVGEEMVKLDIGVHIDGWLADTAVTVDFSGNQELVEAAEEALDAGLDVVEAGVDAGEIGAAIEDVIDGYGYNPVVNLTGHGLGHWEQHTSPTIPNRAVSQGATLEAGDVVAIEPFATDGSGKVSEGQQEEIYMLEREASVRDRSARQALEQITEEFKTLPFATRWLDVSRPEMALRRLKMNDIVHGYPVLKEEDGCLVSQREHTIIVTEDGCEITTRSR
ncbi:type II methionyl aminopeptidase [Halorubellus sp. JP-L1]|uniref:type II methionyl aminopeptidase n=1 Tax=Halorubellus sp. JP-L1 TaxID=2715753 RepID=UPI00140B9A8B|nr:type II methionyl aminopeptidase [Halorubellus sp. JP-L1]NHN41343.1 type II methionyl aminopeptidase [Halorubellus sp. JP-L1]